MPDSFDYTTGTNSENVRLLQALIDDAPEYTEETNSRNANILKSIINNTEYTDAPQSEIEELLLRLKAKIGGEIEVDELNVTENGTYDAGVNKAYNPVTVELPLDSKTITENGTYTASDDNLAGFNEVTVAVEGYAKKSISPAPTAIATFNASALPMPSLNVSIEAVQSGTGDPSPTNVRPISGWSAVNVVDTGVNVWDEQWEVGSYSTSTGEKTEANNRIRCKNPIKVVGGSTIYISSANTNMRIYLYYPNGEYKTTPSTLADTEYTIPDDVGWMTFNMATTYGTTYNNDVSINYPSTNTSYTAYNGTTYTTQLKDGQGNPLTCYGGTLTNENGVQRLEVTHGHIASYNGETLPSTWISDRDVYAEGTTPTIGAEVVYLLATPEEILQDNLPIASQDGTNNLWADSGDIQSGEYMEAL